MHLSKQWKKFLKLLALTTPTIAILYALLAPSTLLQATIAGLTFGLIYATAYTRYTKELTRKQRVDNKETYKKRLDAYLQARGFTQTKQENNTYTYSNHHKLLPERVHATIKRKHATIKGPAPVIKRAPNNNAYK